MPFDANDADLFNGPVMYIADDDMNNIWNAEDPASALTAYADNNTQPVFIYRSRVFIIVVNHTDEPLISKDNYATHGFLSGRPIVTDESDVMQPQPGSGSGNKLGNTNPAWIDAAPAPGYGSVGVWSFTQHNSAWYGVQGAVSIELHNKQLTLLAGATKSYNGSSFGGGIKWVTSASKKTVTDYSDNLEYNEDEMCGTPSHGDYEAAFRSIPVLGFTGVLMIDVYHVGSNAQNNASKRQAMRAHGS